MLISSGSAKGKPIKQRVSARYDEKRSEQMTQKGRTDVLSRPSTAESADHGKDGKLQYKSGIGTSLDKMKYKCRRCGKHEEKKVHSSCLSGAYSVYRSQPYNEQSAASYSKPRKNGNEKRNRRGDDRIPKRFHSSPQKHPEARPYHQEGKDGVDRSRTELIEQ